MGAFIWLVVSGVLWLAVVLSSTALGVLPQTVSLARSIYLSSYTILLVGLMRGGGEARGGAVWLSWASLGWFLLPLVAGVLLAVLSREYRLSSRDALVLGMFYLLQLAFLLYRFSKSQGRNTAFDLAFPIVFTMCCLPALWPLVLLPLGLVLLLRHIDGQGRWDRSLGDSVFMQIPSICIAPALLIALRDLMPGDGWDRKGIEALGMVVNGLGSALWTTLVIRMPSRLLRGSVIAGVSASLVAGASPVVDAIGVGSLAGIVAIECARGALWLGLSHALFCVGKWPGFAINLAFSCASFVGYWLVSSGLPNKMALTVFCCAHLLVPLIVKIITSGSGGPTEAHPVGSPGTG